MSQHLTPALLQVTFRLHRKLIMGAISSLKEQQPVGTAEPGNLWEYIHADPTTAALYVSGVLCTPRLTMLWLHIFEYSTTLGPLLADEDELSSQVPHSADGISCGSTEHPNTLHLIELTDVTTALLHASRAAVRPRDAGPQAHGDCTPQRCDD